MSEIEVAVSIRARPLWRWYLGRYLRLPFGRVALWLVNGTRLEYRVGRGNWEPLGQITATRTGVTYEETRC
jgi:hypothetical protein